ncbi:hypothetical protein I4F81_010151 [Pyropia yezoensis]|uniref:Uncharacterized protein n=1 Tax=Pyropia yezoensis TaxID=2788 RepID=A0ACC3CBL1_PYRYE|nr:hypothetical protein I4F81_010151 [Neopyropia yezoensis]
MRGAVARRRGATPPRRPPPRPAATRPRPATLPPGRLAWHSGDGDRRGLDWRRAGCGRRRQHGGGGGGGWGGRDGRGLTSGGVGRLQRWTLLFLGGGEWGEQGGGAAGGLEIRHTGKNTHKKAHTPTGGFYECTRRGEGRAQRGGGAVGVAGGGTSGGGGGGRGGGDGGGEHNGSSRY